MLTWVTVKFMFPLAILSLSLHGLAFSFVYATAIGAAQNWFPPNRRGFVGSIVLCGYGFGSLIWVPFQTYFVNPDNIDAVPDKDCDENVTVCDRYYTDPELLARVPWMFLISGAIYAVMGLLAVIIISDPKLDTKQESSLEQLDFEKQEYQGKDDHNLRPTEVLRTKTFYKVLFAYNLYIINILYL